MTEREQPSDEAQDTRAHPGAAPGLAASGEQEERELFEPSGFEATPVAASTPLSEPAPPVDSTATTPDRDDGPSGEGERDGGGSLATEHPEVFVVAAFAGGLALAVTLRLVGRG